MILAPGAADDLLVALGAKTTFAAGDGPLAVACSGGPDSTALAVLAARTGRHVTLHHVNHGLRQRAVEDARFVRSLAQLLDVDVVVHEVSIHATSNLEEEARLARFGVMPRDVATGHTMDDQAETVLLNLLRGAGTTGLGAMAPGPRHPILALRRSETHELCEQLGLVTAIDETNEDPRFARNQVRSQLIPLLAAISNRDPVPLLDRTARLARADAELLDALSAQSIHDPTDVALLRAAPLPLASRALRSWLAAERSTQAAPHPPSEAEIERILRVVRGEVVATEIHGGARVARTDGRLRLEQG